MGRKPVFLGFRHVFHGKRSRDLQMVHCLLLRKDPPIRMRDLLSLLDRILFCVRQIAVHYIQIQIYNLQASHIH